MSEARQLIICISHLPYRELSPNSREHFMVKARAVKASREEIGWLAKIEWRYKYGDAKPMEKARISFDFHTKDKRRRDPDNLLAQVKSWIDGLIDVGVIFYDDADHLQIGSVRVIPDTTEETIITVEEVL